MDKRTIWIISKRFTRCLKLLNNYQWKHAYDTL
nr:MAG TPA: hypothetical protein [Caudoviricetes sp.]